MKSVQISEFSGERDIREALLGNYGSENGKNISLTCIKSLVFVNISGPAAIDCEIPTPAAPWHLRIISEASERGVRVNTNKLTVTLANGETASGFYRTK